MKLDKEEQEILEAFEKGELKRAKNADQLMEQARIAARNYMKKDARVNIRLTNRDLMALKSKAEEEGLPYQTLIASVLHKYVTGKLVSKG